MRRREGEKERKGGKGREVGEEGKGGGEGGRKQIPYSGKLSQEKTFHKLVEIKDFCGDNFHE